MAETEGSRRRRGGGGSRWRRRLALDLDKARGNVSPAGMDTGMSVGLAAVAAIVGSATAPAADWAMGSLRRVSPGRRAIRFDAGCVGSRTPHPESRHQRHPSRTARRVGVSSNEALAIPPGRAPRASGMRMRSCGFNEAPAIPPGRGHGSQGAELWHVSCRFASAAPGEPCPKRPTGRPSLRIVKERHVSQCVAAPRALPGNPRALECSQTGRQVRRRLARRL